MSADVQWCFSCCWSPALAGFDRHNRLKPGLQQHTPTLPERGADRRFVDWRDQSLFRDDAGDQPRRRDVEGGVVDRNAVGCRLPAEAVRHLTRVALLDGNAIAARQTRSNVLDGAAT